MKTFETFLYEEMSNAKKQALQMGLKYRGFGYWEEPKTGKIRFKTVNGELKPIDKDEELKLNSDDEFSNEQEKSYKEQDDNEHDNISELPDTKTNPGEGIGFPVEPQEYGWTPGPDGDNAFGDEFDEDTVDNDIFVGKNNAINWIAGPDGTNFKNLSFDKMIEDFLFEELLKKNIPGAETQMQNVLDGTGNTTQRKAASAIRRMGPNTQMDKVQQMKDIVNQSNLGSVDKANVQRAFLKRIPSYQRNQETLKKLNAKISEYFQKPDFSLDTNNLRVIGSGAYGAGYITDDGQHIIKSGQIGRHELEVLHKLRDNKHFPNLINGVYEEPFIEYNTFNNNPENITNLRRPEGASQYNVRSVDYEYATAPGKFAMSMAKGKPAISSDIFYDNNNARTEALKKIWQAREALHRAGYSHNDMHGGNIIVDDDGNPTILDFGLAKNNKLSALLEALGGVTNSDTQLFRHARYDKLPEDIRDLINTNYNKVLRKLFDITKQHGHDYDARRLRNGAIRVSNSELDRLQKKFGLNDEMLDDLINTFYSGLTPSDLEQRMSAAYDKRLADATTLDTANKIRKRRGAAPIPTPRGVVPMRNLIKDKTPEYYDD